MCKINLKDFYPNYYLTDEFINVDDATKEALEEFRRKERNYIRKMIRKRIVSLEHIPEHEIRLMTFSPEEVFEIKLTESQLKMLVNKLPEKQCRRINLFFYHGLTLTEISKIENVSPANIKESIDRGIANISKRIKKYL